MAKATADVWGNLNVLSCKQCNLKTDNVGLMQAHHCKSKTQPMSADVTFNKASQLFTCSLCAISLPEEQFKEHLETHMSLKPYVCDYCKNDFSSRNDVLEHLKSTHKQSQLTFLLRLSGRTKEIILKAKTNGKEFYKPIDNKTVPDLKGGVPKRDVCEAPATKSSSKIADSMQKQKIVKKSKEAVTAKVSQPVAEQVPFHRVQNLSLAETNAVSQKNAVTVCTSGSQVPSGNSKYILLLNSTGPISQTVTLLPNSPVVPSHITPQKTPAPLSATSWSHLTILPASALQQSPLLPESSTAVQETSLPQTETPANVVCKNSPPSHNSSVFLSKPMAQPLSAVPHTGASLKLLPSHLSMRAETQTFCQLLKQGIEAVSLGNEETPAITSLGYVNADRFQYLCVVKGYYLCLKCRNKWCTDNDLFFKHIWLKHAHETSFKCCPSGYSPKCRNLKEIVNLIYDKSQETMSDQVKEYFATGSSSSLQLTDEPTLENSATACITGNQPHKIAVPSGHKPYSEEGETPLTSEVESPPVHTATEVPLQCGPEQLEPSVTSLTDCAQNPITPDIVSNSIRICTRSSETAGNAESSKDASNDHLDRLISVMKQDQVSQSVIDELTLRSEKELNTENEVPLTNLNQLLIHTVEDPVLPALTKSNSVSRKLELTDKDHPRQQESSTITLIQESSIESVSDQQETQVSNSGVLKQQKSSDDVIVQKLLSHDVVQRQQQLSDNVVHRQQHLSDDVFQRQQQLSDDVVKGQQQLSHDVVQRQKLLSHDVVQRQQQLSLDVVQRQQQLSLDTDLRQQDLTRVDAFGTTQKSTKSISATHQESSEKSVDALNASQELTKNFSAIRQMSVGKIGNLLEIEHQKDHLLLSRNDILSEETSGLNQEILPMDNYEDISDDERSGSRNIVQQICYPDDMPLDLSKKTLETAQIISQPSTIQSAQRSPLSVSSVLRKERTSTDSLSNDDSENLLKCFYECGFLNCQFTTPKREDLMAHNVLHHKEEHKFPCVYCGLRSPSNEELILHMEQHIKNSSAKTFSCSLLANSDRVAQFEVNDIKFMIRLLQNSVSVEEESNTVFQFTCNVCQSEFLDIEQLQLHLQDSLLKVIECKHCKSYFRNSFTWQKHMNTEHEQLPKMYGIYRKLLCHDRNMNRKVDEFSCRGRNQLLTNFMEEDTSSYESGQCTPAAVLATDIITDCLADNYQRNLEMGTSLPQVQSFSAIDLLDKQENNIRAGAGAAIVSKCDSQDSASIDNTASFLMDKAAQFEQLKNTVSNAHNANSSHSDCTDIRTSDNIQQQSKIDDSLKPTYFQQLSSGLVERKSSDKSSAFDPKSGTISDLAEPFPHVTAECTSSNRVKAVPEHQSMGASHSTTVIEIDDCFITEEDSVLSLPNTKSLTSDCSERNIEEIDVAPVETREATDGTCNQNILNATNIDFGDIQIESNIEVETSGPFPQKILESNQSHNHEKLMPGGDSCVGTNNYFVVADVSKTFQNDTLSNDRLQNMTSQECLIKGSNSDTSCDILVSSPISEELAITSHGQKTSTELLLDIQEGAATMLKHDRDAHILNSGHICDTDIPISSLDIGANQKRGVDSEIPVQPLPVTPGFLPPEQLITVTLKNNAQDKTPNESPLSSHEADFELGCLERQTTNESISSNTGTSTPIKVELGNQTQRSKTSSSETKSSNLGNENSSANAEILERLEASIVKENIGGDVHEEPKTKIENTEDHIKSPRSIPDKDNSEVINLTIDEFNVSQCVKALTFKLKSFQQKQAAAASEHKVAKNDQLSIKSPKNATKDTISEKSVMHNRTFLTNDVAIEKCLVDTRKIVEAGDKAAQLTENSDLTFTLDTVKSLSANHNVAQIKETKVTSSQLSSCKKSEHKIFDTNVSMRKQITTNDLEVGYDPKGEKLQTIRTSEILSTDIASRNNSEIKNCNNLSSPLSRGSVKTIVTSHKPVISCSSKVVKDSTAVPTISQNPSERKLQVITKEPTFLNGISSPVLDSATLKRLSGNSEERVHKRQRLEPLTTSASFSRSPPTSTREQKDMIYFKCSSCPEFRSHSYTESKKHIQSEHGNDTRAKIRRVLSGNTSYELSHFSEKRRHTVYKCLHPKCSFECGFDVEAMKSHVNAKHPYLSCGYCNAHFHPNIISGLKNHLKFQHRGMKPLVATGQIPLHLLFKCIMEEEENNCVASNISMQCKDSSKGSQSSVTDNKVVNLHKLSPNGQKKPERSSPVCTPPSSNIVSSSGSTDSEDKLLNVNISRTINSTPVTAVVSPKCKSVKKAHDQTKASKSSILEQFIQEMPITSNLGSNVSAVLDQNIFDRRVADDLQTNSSPNTASQVISINLVSSDSDMPNNKISDERELLTSNKQISKKSATRSPLTGGVLPKRSSQPLPLNTELSDQAHDINETRDLQVLTGLSTSLKPERAEGLLQSLKPCSEKVSSLKLVRDSLGDALSITAFENRNNSCGDPASHATPEVVPLQTLPTADSLSMHLGDSRMSSNRVVTPNPPMKEQKAKKTGRWKASYMEIKSAKESSENTHKESENMEAMLERDAAWQNSNVEKNKKIETINVSHTYNHILTKTEYPFRCAQCRKILRCIIDIEDHFHHSHPGEEVRLTDRKSGCIYSSSGQCLGGKSDINIPSDLHLCRCCAYRSKKRSEVDAHIQIAHPHMEGLVFTMYKPVSSEIEVISKLPVKSVSADVEEPKMTSPAQLSYYCHLCQEYSKTEFLFRLHLATHPCFKHTTVQRSALAMMCHTCGYMAQGKADLAGHTAMHMSERRFKCSLCEQDGHNRQCVRTHIKAAHNDQAEVIDRSKAHKLSVPRLVDIDPKVVLINPLRQNGDYLQSVVMRHGIRIINLSGDDIWADVQAHRHDQYQYFEVNPLV